MSTVAAPVVGSPLPLASLAMTLITQVAREGTAGFWIASGGPKTQFSTGWHAPAGVAPGGTVLARPPPMYSQDAPRSLIFVVQAASESISPENGVDAGLERPAPPQPVVPAAVVYLSDRRMVVLVVLDVVVDVVVGAALLDVVVGAALLDVVVGAALLDVVVGAALLDVVVGAALLDVVVGAALLDVVVGAALLDVVVGAALLDVV